MASDRVKSLMQRLWMAENIAESEALLDAFEREVKIDEAKTIEELFDRCTDTRQFAGTLDRHIFELAAQPTPEVKK